MIHHSDQGSQYTSLAFGLRCREAGVRPSMGSVGDSYDNAMCESFFATLECELLDRHASRPRPRPGWPSSTSSRAGTTPTAGTRRSTTSRPSRTKGSTRRPRDPKAVHPPRNRVNSSRPGLDAYKIVLYRQDDGSWVAEVPAISGCYALMATREEALAELGHVFDMIAQEYQERGTPLPEDTTEIVNA